MKKLSVSVCAAVTLALVLLTGCGGGSSSSPTPSTTSSPTFSASSQSLAFGNQLVNTSGTATTLTVTNNGGSSLVVSQITMGGPSAADFRLVAPVQPMTIAAGASAAIQVTFAPATAGDRTASLSITDNATGSPHSVTLTGHATAPAISITNSAVEYGTQSVSGSLTKSVLVSNTGDGNLIVSNVSVGGANAGDFALGSPASVTVQPGNSTTISVSFKPTTSGKRTGSVILADNSSATAHTVATLSGTGVAVGPKQVDDASVVLTPNVISAPSQYPTTFDVAITGTNTNFTSGATVANFGPGSTVTDGTSTALPGQFGLVRVSGPTSASATVTFDDSVAPGPRTVIVDTGGHSSAATFLVPARANGPVAGAGSEQLATVGKTVYLDGSSSTVGGTPAISAVNTDAAQGSASTTLTFNWKLTSAPAGSAAVLNDATSVRPSFVPDLPGTYFFQLTVNDGTTSTSTWTSISTDNTVPNAKAGARQFVAKGATVGLDGSGSSDPDGSMLTFQWTLVSKPSGSAAALSNAQVVAPTFTADLDGDYLFQLTVNDGHGNTGSDITLVSTLGSSPTANAGGVQKVAISQSVQLDGSASIDPDGDTITCAWMMISRPAASTAALVNAGPGACTVKASFTADQTGIYVAQLVVTDSHNNQSVATTLISTADFGPIANAGSHRSVNVGTTVELDGSKSVDLDGDALTYHWSPVSLPVGSGAALSQASAVRPVFVPDKNGDYVFQLVVSDAGGLLSPPSTVLITASSAGFSAKPTAVSFGNQTIHTTSDSSSIVITNTGGGDLVLNSVAISGANASDFVFTSPALPASVPAGTTTNLNVTFTPSAAGARSGTVTVTHNAGSAAQIALTGTGTTPGIQLTPTTLSFGSQVVNTTSVTQTIAVKNTGTGNLILFNVTVTGANAADFAFTSGTFPVTVAPGATANISVVFRPLATGARSAVLNISDNLNATAETIALAGNGTAPSISAAPNPVNFSGQLKQSASSPVALTLSNGGTADLVISALSFTGTNAADFSIANAATLPLTVTTGQSTTLNLVFTPGDIGNRTATLAISHNAGSSPLNVNVGGTGTLAGIVVPASVDFGNALVGTAAASQSVSISNNGSANLNITAVSISGSNASDYSFAGAAPATPITVTPGNTTTITLGFTPASAGSRTAVLSLTSNAGARTIALNGLGAAPDISISPSPVAFGNQLRATTSAPLTVTLINTGTAPLVISAISRSGANSSDFAVNAGPLPLTINPTTSATMTVTFTPSLTGAESATLNVTDNTGAGSHSVALTGTGTAPDLSISPSPVAFGNQLKATTSAPLTVTLTNTGTASLVISAIGRSGANSSDFAISFAPLPITVAVGATTTVTVTFTPTTTTSEAASLNVTDNTSVGSHSVALTGTGVAPQIVLSPASTLAFGTQLLNTASAAGTITISNPGTGDLSISTIAFSGSNATDFALSTAPTFPILVTAGNSTTIGVIFTPKTLNSETATLSFTDNVSGSPHTLGLTGTGVAPAVAPLSPVNFGSINVGSSSTSVNVTVTNTGTAPLHITALSFGGANPGDFSTTTTTPITVAANNGTTTIAVKFSPTAVGSRAGTLLVTDDAIGSPHSASLSGTGVGVPIFSISPTSLTFGDTNVGFTSATQALTITNTGTADLTISHLVKTGANGSDFFYAVLGTQGSSDFPETLTPGASLTVNISFRPSGAGSRTANLVFQDQNSTTLGVVPVSGNGVPPTPQMSLNPTSLSFPNTLIGNSSALGIVLTNNGTGDLTVSSLAISGTNASDFTFTPAAPFTVPKSGGTLTVTVTFRPAAKNARSATLSITNDAGNTVHVDSVSLSGNGFYLGRLLLNPTSVGRNLEVLAIGSVDAAPASNLAITISSSDASKVLLSPQSTDPSGTSTGVSSFVGTLPAGKGVNGNGFPSFNVQSLASSGTAQVTMTAAGYEPASATITLTPAGFTLSGGANFTTNLGAPDTNLSVNTAQLDAAGNIIATDQKLRGGISVSIAVNNTSPSIGSITGSPVSLQGGSISNAAGTLTFHPISGGSTVLSITQPSGFTAPASGAQLTATVRAPTITLSPNTVGNWLQVQGSGSLNTAAPSGGLVVTIVSSDATKVLLTANPAVVGSSSIQVTVPAGGTLLPVFYIQGLASAGSVTLTASGSGYVSGSGNILLTPSAFIINSPNGGGNFTTTTLSSATTLTVSVAQLIGGGATVPGDLAGGQSMSVAVTSNNLNAGGIAGSPVTFQTGVQSKTVSFLPNANCSAPCSTVVSVTEPAGFSTPVGAQITATVTAPSVTLRMTQSLIGKDLQISATGSLDVNAPNDMQVTITSGDPGKILLSTSPTIVGGSSITFTVFANSGANSIGFPSYYVQSLTADPSAAITLTVTTSVGSGFVGSTFNVTPAPSGFVLEGPDGVGTPFPTALSNGDVPLTVRAAVLNASSCSPGLDLCTPVPGLYEQVRGGLTATVNVSTNNSGVATIGGSPLAITGGNSSGTVTLQPQALGQATISATSPAGFSQPSSGGQLSVTVN